MVNISLNSITNLLYATITGNLVGFIMVVLLISSFISRVNRTLLGAWFANIMGVSFHELAHYTIGRTLGAKPIKFTIVPKKTLSQGGQTIYILGHVDFRNLKWYNTVPTALAPLFLLLIAIWIENNFWEYFNKTLLNLLFFIYLIIVFVVNAVPSNQDFKVAFSSTLGLLLWLFIFPVSAYFSYVYLGINHIIT